MSPEEQRAVDDLKSKQALVKLRAFDMLRYFIRGDVQLSNCGYKSLEHALQKIMADSNKELQNIEKDFLRQYPD
jgi:hypothetical protein